MHAQQLQAQYYDKKWLPAPELKPDQLVWLLHRHIKTTRPSDKLDHCRLGPYRVICKIGSSSYLLALPSYLTCLHPVFHVSLLEPYKDPSEFHTHADPEPFKLADDPALFIDKIIDSRHVRHCFKYFVHFRSLPDSENLWLPLSDIPRTYDELIDHYHR